MNSLSRIAVKTARSLHAVITQDPRWLQVLERDAAASFFFSVASTGVYCRPSCPARRPRAENVRFHETAAAAERAGFRACKRCKPREQALSAQHTAKIAKACRIIEAAETPPALEDLSAGVGLSPSHFHRLFKKQVGVTPADYARAHREAKVRSGLKGNGSVTAAIFDAGYNTSSRFYENTANVLGMTPKTYRAGGSGLVIHFALGRSSLGHVLVAQSGKGICAILLGDEREAMIAELRQRFPKAELVAGDGAFEKVVAQVVAFVDEPARGLELPLDIRGTAFQQRVWRALRKIPAGETVTYGEVAKRIESPAAIRAVASACAANPLGVVVPCHRVVRNDGSLAGYYWGIDRKKALLEKERRSVALRSKRGRD